MRLKTPKSIIAFIAIAMILNLASDFSCAIEENTQAKNSKWKITIPKKNKEPISQENNLKKSLFKKSKNTKEIEEIKLPAIIQAGKYNGQYSVMTIEDCVNYAIEHNPNLLVAKAKINTAKAGIGQAKSTYAPKFYGGVAYLYTNNTGTSIPVSKDSLIEGTSDFAYTNRMLNSSQNTLAVGVGISETIWDFGKTTAKINMAKFDTNSAQYDYDYAVLNVVYNVRINYFKVLSALARLDILEQNVRINTLNYERTKSMFDEGLKSKIDVVNAQVNLTEAKTKFIDGQNMLETAIIQLKNAMFWQEDNDFTVKNTENFNFLKADYKKMIESITSINTKPIEIKQNKEGIFTLSSGIEHKDIIQNFEFKPLVISQKEAVEEALELRPDLKSTRMLVNVQKEAIKAIKKNFMPEIKANASFGYIGNDAIHGAPFKAGVSAGFNQVDPYYISQKIKEGESYLDIASHNVNITKTGIFWEVQNNYINMRQLERKIPLMNLNVKATLENFELADGRYSVGLNSYIELQNALANYNSAQLSFVDSVFKYNVARETLLKSMGVR